MSDDFRIGGRVFARLVCLVAVGMAALLSVPFAVRAQERNQSLIVRVNPGIDRKQAVGLVSEAARRMGAVVDTREFLAGERTNVRLFSASGLDRYLVVEAKEGEVERLALSLGRLDAIDAVFSNHRYHIESPPDDSLYAQQWGLKAIDVEGAWNITTGDSVTIVGVIDTGIDFAHPDLAGAIWINKAEDRNGNGQFDPWPFDESRNGLGGDIDFVDQDNNGYADDVVGYDFVDQTVKNQGDWSGRDAIPYEPFAGDANAHGTNVAGIIGARRNNRIGIAGIAPEARLLAVRAFDVKGDGEDDDIAAAIVYAADRGARVINMSFGDAYYSPLMRDAVRYAYAKGAVLVASSGNDGGVYRHYPSGYPEVIAVAAVDSKALRTTFSTSGSQLSISAPGSGIATTSTAGRYTTTFGGTSAAAPHVAGVAALIRSLHPNWSPDEVRTAMELGARDLNITGWDVDYGAGLLNARHALESPGPASVTIRSPEVDAGFRGDTTVTVIGSAMAPFLESWQLFYGLGEVPRAWTAIGARRKEGRVLDTLGTFSTNGLPDTLVTLRLLLQLTNGTQTERRVQIYVDRSKPRFVSTPDIRNVWRFTERAISIVFRSDDPTRGVLRLRRSDRPTEPYRSLELEPERTGLTYHHYYYLTSDELEREIPYDLYIELRNMAGDTALYGSPAAPLRIVREGTAFPIGTFHDTLSRYTLPFGFPLDKSVGFFGDGSRSIIMNRFVGGGFDHLAVYTFDGQRFVRTDSTGNWVPRGIGDSDGNGLLEALGQDANKGVMFEQSAPGSSPLARVKFVDTTTRDFSVAAMDDIDGDGSEEIIAHSNDEDRPYYYVAKWNGSRYEQIARLDNTTRPASGQPFNRYGNSDVAVGDFDGDGLPELLVADDDNDFMAYERGTDGTFSRVWSSENEGDAGSPLFAAGDLDGDGADEIVIAYRSSLDKNVVREYDAPYWTVRAYKRFNDGRDSVMWSERIAYVRAPKTLRSTVAVADLDGRPGRELILSLYPNLYVFRWDDRNGMLKPLWYKGDALNYKLIAQDFNRDGLAELGTGIGDSIIRFFQIDPKFRGPETPTALHGWATSDSTVYLEWTGGADADYYTIYRARITGASRIRFDSISVTTAASFVDGGSRRGEIVTSNDGTFDTIKWTANTFYNYIVTARDRDAQSDESRFSNAVAVYTHKPASILSIVSVDERTFRLEFDVLLREGLYRSGALSVTDATSGEEIPISTIVAASDLALVVTLRNDHGGDSLQVIPTGLFRDRFESVADTTRGFGVRMIGPEASGERFVATRGSVAGDHRIAVDFNAPVDPGTDGNAEYYSIDPPGTILSARIDPDNPSRVILELASDYQLVPLGREYIVTIMELRAADGRLINDGTGSVVGFTIAAENLEQVFVYPHPFSLSRDGTVTFAGITRSATVEIFTQAGTIIREIPVVHSAGGAVWDGRDARGEPTPTGIYLYRVTGSNADGSSFESEMRKLAVVP